MARAVTSPSGILLLGVGASVGILTGGGLLGAALLGVLAWAARIGAAIPRGPADSRIDPFTLSEPWRRYVADALQAKARFQESVDGARAGPLQDRLREIQDRVDTGVREVWRIARRGHDLVDARRRVDPDAIRAELTRAAALGAQSASATSIDQRMMESLQAQLATVERIEAVINDTDGRLRLLNARLDEAAARTIELSIEAHDVADLGGLGDDVDQMVGEMESLRQAIEETGGGTPVAEPG